MAAPQFDPPARAGFKSDDAFHRRNLRALTEFLRVQLSSIPIDRLTSGILAASVNESGGGRLLGADGYPRVKLINTSGDTLTTATETTLTYASGGYTSDGWWNGSNSYIIAPWTGQYLVASVVSFAASAVGRRYVQLQSAPSPYSVWTNLANLSGFVTVQPVGTDRTTAVVSELIDLNALDGLRVRAFQSSGGNLNAQIRHAVMFMGPS